MQIHGAALIPNARTGQQMPIQKEVLDDIEANRSRFNILGTPRFLYPPLLIIQGEADQPRLVEGAHKMAETAPKATLQILKGANHTFGAVHPFQGTTPDLKKHFNKRHLSFKKHFPYRQANKASKCWPYWSRGSNYMQ